jgi:Flp pilus assembly protein protease CpaA
MLLLIVIMITGTFTIFTDLKSKKIYNHHVLLSAFLGLAAIIFTTITDKENVTFHLINGLVASVIGFCLYRFDLWRGGDAKLFALYAFLMPPFHTGNTIFSTSIALFACSFIAGMMIFLPLFIKDFTANKNGEFDWANLKPPLEAVQLTIFFSWILFPVYFFTTSYFAGIIHTTIIFQIITYVIYVAARRFLKDYVRLNYATAGIGIVFGLLMRLWLNPHSLSWPELPVSILRIALFSALSALIFVTQLEFKSYQDRVPFAPLLFIGCLLSYTSFLTWIKYLTQP